MSKTDFPVSGRTHSTPRLLAKKGGECYRESDKISDPPIQAEAQALRDKCEDLADDVRALSALVHALRGALVSVGLVKGSA